MAVAQVKVIGLKDLSDNCKAIARVITGDELADSLAVGAMEVVQDARRNIMSQGLYDTMALWNSVKPVKINQYRVDVRAGGDGVEHAAVHEYGLENQVITDRQRRFFWAKWNETGDEMWKALALSTTYTIPARPYLRPAVDTAKHDAWLQAASSLGGKIAHAVKAPTGG